MGRKVLLAVLMFSGCVSTLTPFLSVDLALTSVQRPADVAERWGDYTLSPADSSGYTYEDGMVSVAVVPLFGSFSAVIRNRTEHSIRLLWAEGAYVGPSGLASGIVPGETRWIDMGNTPGPQVIPSGSMAAVTVIPRATADISETEIDGFYGDGGCSDVPGTDIRHILPLEIEGIINEYTLRFEPGLAEMVTYRYDSFSESITDESRTRC